MTILNKIKKEEIRDLLGKGWLTHDGMWFYHTAKMLGVKEANLLNRAAIKSLAPIEMQRTLELLGLDRDSLDTPDKIKEFMLGALELMVPASIFNKGHFNSSQGDILSWEWEKGECFAYKGLKQLGLLDDYRCGVIYRIECWLDALGIEHEINPKTDTCMMHEKCECKGEIRLSLLLIKG